MRAPHDACEERRDRVREVRCPSEGTVHAAGDVFSLTGAMTMAMHVGSRAPHGGVFVAFAITNFAGFLLAILVGAAVSTALVILLKGLGRNKDGKDAAEAQPAAAAA